MRVFFRFRLLLLGSFCALLAGALSAFLSPAARADSVTVQYSVTDSAQQFYYVNDEEGYADIYFTLTGGHGAAALTRNVARTFAIGSSRLSGQSDGYTTFTGLNASISYALTLNDVTLTLTRPDVLDSDFDGNDFQAVDVQSGPTTRFDLGTAGLIDVTPVEYKYNNEVTTGSPPKSLYTFLLLAPGSPLSSLKVSASSVIYPASATGTITLSHPAVSGGQPVTLLSSNPAAASVPVNVSVPAGKTTATFPITTYRVDTDTSVTLSAKAGGTTKTVSFTVKTRPETAFTYSFPGQPELRFTNNDRTGTYVAISATGGSGTVKLTQDVPYTIPIGTYHAEGESSSYISVNNQFITRALSLDGHAQNLTQGFHLECSTDDFSVFEFYALLQGGPTLVYDLGKKGRVELTATGFTAGTDDDPYTTSALYTFTLRAPNTASSLLVSPEKVYGGATTYGKITLAKAAGIGGQTVSLASSDASAASVPTSIIVPEGVKSAVFPITTDTTDEDTAVTITATSGGTGKMAALNVLSRYAFSGTVRSGSNGFSGVTVNAASTGSFILTSTAVNNQAIPDKSTTGLSTILKPKGTGIISGLVVGVDIAHPHIGDLRITLTGPDGTSAVLYNQSGGSQQNILASYPVLRTPVDSLSVFNGKQVAGTWKLLVQDLVGGQAGTLHSWNLTFTYQGTVTGSGTTASDGTYTVPDLKEGTYTATPTKSGTTFTPASRSVTVGPTVVDPDPTGIDFARK